MKRPSMQRLDSGLTLIEILFSLLILGILTATLSTVFVSSLQSNASADRRTRASQLMTAVAQQVAQNTIVVAQDATRYLAYTPQSNTAFLDDSDTITSCDTYLSVTDNRENFCVRVSNTETFNPATSSGPLLSAPARLYTIQVNWRERGVTRNLATKTLK